MSLLHRITRATLPSPATAPPALGLIAAALPRARIVHIRRRPMDACYAMYKTLFRMAYPFSYDLRDLGQYWLAYERLMRHWRALLGLGHLARRGGRGAGDHDGHAVRTAAPLAGGDGAHAGRIRFQAGVGLRDCRGGLDAAPRRVPGLDRRFVCRVGAVRCRGIARRAPQRTSGGRWPGCRGLGRQPSRCFPRGVLTNSSTRWLISLTLKPSAQEPPRCPLSSSNRPCGRWY